MKKILALVLTCLLLVGSIGIVAFATTANDGAQPVAAAANKLYLVPGTYMSGSTKVANTVSGNGVRKLTQAECDEIFTENAYECTLAVGAMLPTPSSTRTDSNNKKFTFNGWWAIVEATVTYFDRVPSASSGITFLYADWRADLSQRKDPVAPGGVTVTGKVHYLTITRAADKQTEKITLHRGIPGYAPNAEKLGYNDASELSTTITLNVGDVITVYTTGLVSGEDAVAAPIALNYEGRTRTVTLDSDTNNGFITSNYVTPTVPASYRSPVTLTCKQAGKYDIYIKFFSGGTNMSVYMQPKA